MRALQALYILLNFVLFNDSELLNRNWNDTDVSILPIYRQMIADGLRVWVFRLEILYLLLTQSITVLFLT